MSLGLSLSGGGSRAMAFHRGTLEALEDLGILPSINVVSTVSGGSIFGAAWMASKNRGEDTGRFLNYMGEELEKGFIARSIRPRAARMFLPGKTRSNVLADTFDSIFFEGFRLGELPDKPMLCVNVSVLNNGHVGKFSRGDFRCAGIVSPENRNSYSEPVAMAYYPLSLAATASAAYPGLLAPIYLKRGEGGVPEGWGRDGLEGHGRFALVDGGVLDNMGVQSLLSEKSGFGTWDIIASDAGTREDLWKPQTIAGKAINSIWGTILSAVCIGTGFLSIGDLKRVAEVMFNKEVRQMRRQLFAEQSMSWLETAIAGGNVSEALKSYAGWRCGKTGANSRRKLLFVRINQDWGKLITNIPIWRLMELREKAGLSSLPLPEKGNLEKIEEFLVSCGVDLSKAKEIYEMMGGTEAVRKANLVPTRFYALSKEDIDILYHHARWQVHLLNEIYWK